MVYLNIFSLFKENFSIYLLDFYVFIIIANYFMTRVKTTIIVRDKIIKQTGVFIEYVTFCMKNYLNFNL